MNSGATGGDADLIGKALTCLRAGELVAIPTETVYGLAADASNPAAVAKIFTLKGRPTSRPLIVHIGDAVQLEEWARSIPAYAWAWARQFWPGPLTLVLPRQPWVSDSITGGQNTVALRIPNHPLTLELLRRFGGGLAAPSANRYGHISPTSAAHVRQEFGAEAPLILDGGPCQVGIESTIVACLDAHPVVLRPGAVTPEALAQAAEIPVRVGGAESGIVVPGQVTSHYAPQTPTMLLRREQLAAWRPEDSAVGFLGFSPPPFPVIAERHMPGNPAAAAQRLYAALRELDAAGLDQIVVEAPPETGEWAALWDRLRRAAAP